VPACGGGAKIAAFARPECVPAGTAIEESMFKAARSLTFKCVKCQKSMQVYLQKTSACSHIAPYQGLCQCGELRRHATGQADAVKSYLESPVGAWSHHH